MADSPKNVAPEYAGLVLEPAETGSKRRHVPLGHVEGRVDDRLTALLGSLLQEHDK